MTKLTNSPVARKEGSIAIKKDGTKVKMATIKLALEDYEFIIEEPPKGLGMSFTEYVRGKIEADMLKHQGRVTSSNLKSMMARDIYIKNKFYNDVHDRLAVAMNDWFKDQNINRGHLRTAIDTLAKIVDTISGSQNFAPDWDAILNDVMKNSITWREAEGNPLKESAANASDLLIVILKFFTRVRPTISECNSLIKTMRTLNYFDKMDTSLQPSEAALSMLSGKLACRDDPNRFQGWEDDDVQKPPWEE